MSWCELLIVGHWRWWIVGALGRNVRIMLSLPAYFLEQSRGERHDLPCRSRTWSHNAAEVRVK